MIDQRAKDACDNVNGHTSAVAKRYYLLKSREEDALQSQLIGNVIALPGSQEAALLPSRIQNGSLIASSISNPNNHPLSEAWLSKDWGTAHSCYGSNRSRATWDPAELNYIRHEVSTLQIAKGKGIVPALLQRIQEDENAIPIFLLRHIRDAGRLSHGYKQMLKMKEANSEYENNGTGDTYYLTSEEGLFEL